MKALLFSLLAILILACDTDTEVNSAACILNPSAHSTPTFHGDRARLGWTSSEPDLRPDVVAGPDFGHLWDSEELDSLTIGDKLYAPHLYASPLFIENVKLTGGAAPGVIAGVVLAASSNGWVYAINAFETKCGGHHVEPGNILWKTRLVTASVVPRLDGGMPMGIMSTPFVDTESTPPRVYVAAADTVAGWQVFAIDLGNGGILPGWPVSLRSDAVESANTNGPARFEPAPVLSQRGALNLSLDRRWLYVPFGAYYDGGVGWMVVVDTQRPTIGMSFSSAPSTVSDANGGIWAASGVAIDKDGRVYATTGNSPENSADAPGVWGNSLVAWNPPLTLAATYTPFNYCELDKYDTDLGGSSTLLLPDLDPSSTSTPHLLAFGGKQGSVYLVDRDHLSGRTDHRPSCSTDAASDTSLLPPTAQPQFGTRGPLNVFGPYSEKFANLDFAKMRSIPAYFCGQDNTNYILVSGTTKASLDSNVGVPPCLARLRVVTEAGKSAYLAIDAFETSSTFVNPGSPVVTSQGGTNAIVWVLDENAQRTASLVDPNVPHPVLYAVDAMSMRLLWRSLPNQLYVGGKYSTVAVSRGTVFVGTNRIQAFGVRKK